MARSLLMAALFVPLAACGFYGYKGVMLLLQQPAAAPSPSAAATKGAADPVVARKTELEEIESKTAKLAGTDPIASDAIARSVVLLEDLPPGPPPAGPLAEELRSHLQKRAEGRKTVAVSEHESDKTRDEIETTRRALLSNGELRDNPTELAHLREQIEAYEKLDVRDAERIRSIRAEVDWVPLNKKHPATACTELYKALDDWKPGPVTTLPPPDEMEKTESELRKFTGEYAGVKGPEARALLAEATRRQNLWERGRWLAEHVRNLADWNQQLAAIRDIVRRASEDDSPDEFKRSARKVLVALAEDLKREEPLDELVSVDRGTLGALEPRERSKIKVIWKDGKSALLKDTGVDEFDFPYEKVEIFQFTEGGTFEPSRDRTKHVLLPTEYSKAVKAYNEARKKAPRVSLADLRQLIEVCKPNQAVLGEQPGRSGASLLARLDGLLKIVEPVPNLFLP